MIFYRLVVWFVQTPSPLQKGTLSSQSQSINTWRAAFAGASIETAVSSSSFSIQSWIGTTSGAVQPFQNQKIRVSVPFFVKNSLSSCFCASTSASFGTSEDGQGAEMEELQERHEAELKRLQAEHQATKFCVGDVLRCVPPSQHEASTQAFFSGETLII